MKNSMTGAVPKRRMPSNIGRSVDAGFIVVAVRLAYLGEINTLRKKRPDRVVMSVGC